MTMITYLDQHRASHPARQATPKLGWLSALSDRLRVHLNRRKTERMLEGLPQDIRKDIGWPTPAGK